MKLRNLLPLFAVILPLSAHASNLLGDTVNLDYIYPTVGTVYEVLPTIVVPGSSSVFGENLVTITPTTISITTLVNGVTYTPASFNGYLFTDLDQNFSSVTLDPISTLTPTSFSFSGDEFSLNLSGLEFFTGDNVTFDVNSGSVSATPEPSSLVLLGTGILGAAGAARRRFKR